MSDLPILGICGWSGSGKTTLIESVLPGLNERGLKTVVVKHTCHRFDIDREGKDTDRFFNTGSDVTGHSPTESFLRLHGNTEPDLNNILMNLAGQYDLVFLEGYKDVPVHKVWLHRPGESEIPKDITRLLADFAFTPERRVLFESRFDEWFHRQWRKPPVYACVLIGGGSRRMGIPKHLLPCPEGTWLERTVRILVGVMDNIVIAGKGEIPESLGEYVRLPDAPGVEGPMAGLISAMRWHPGACWLAVPCDLPMLSKPALSWLLSQRRPGTSAVLPRLTGKKNVEPLLAYYDFRSQNLIESLASRMDFRLANLTIHPQVKSPSPPEEYEIAWNNVNTPKEFQDTGGI